MTKLTQKKVKFEWGDKQEAAFQLLKQKLCSASILALPREAEEFHRILRRWSKKGLGSVLFQREKSAMFIDHKSLQHILDQKELHMRQRRWLRIALVKNDSIFVNQPMEIANGTSRKSGAMKLNVKAKLVPLVKVDVTQESPESRGNVKTNSRRIPTPSSPRRTVVSAAWEP
ncbi:putative reverse transcriptase domain-containing protein [Tanacetum coccineum]